MSTHLDLLRLRSQEATAAREAAEQILLAIMVGLNPRLGRWPPALALQSRALEALIEHPAAPRDLVHAHGAYRRAVKAERKARSAAHAARFQSMPSAGPSIAARPLTPSEVHQEILERRLAA
jgi:hypothetical protein